MTRFLDGFVKTVVAACMGAMVVTVTWQVVSRYALGDPSSWTEELARMLLIWVGLLGGVYVYSERAHLGLDLLRQKVGPVGQFRLDMIADICCGAFALGVLIIGGASLVQLTWELKQTTAVLGIPMAWVYAVLPLSGFLILYYSIVFIVERSKGASQ